MKFCLSPNDRNKSGIYAIRSSVDERLYIGASKRLNQRFQKHKELLKNQKHYNSGLQLFVDTYGIDKLSFELIEFCTPENLLERERHFIYLYQAIDPDKGFNQRAKGCELPESARLNMSKAGKGKIISDETKAKMSAAQKGRTTTRPGYKLSESTKAALAAGLRAATEQGKFKGRVLTEEHKAKISASSKGRIISDETRAKMAAASKARASDPKFKAEFVARMKAHYGKK